MGVVCSSMWPAMSRSLSDSFANEWLNDEATGFSVSQTAGHLFPQCFGGGTMDSFVVPVPWEKEGLPLIVKRYMGSPWR